MKKTLIVIITIFLVLSSISPAFAEISKLSETVKSEIKLLTDDNMIIKKSGYILYNEDNEFKLQWERNPEVSYYMLLVDGILHCTSYNEFELIFNDSNNHVISILGIDKGNNAISVSKDIVTTLSIEEYDSVYFSGGRINVVSEETRNLQNISWGLVKNADYYKVSYYENDVKILEENTELNFAGLVRFNNEDKDANWEIIIQAFNGDKLLTEGSIYFTFVADLKKYYDMGIKGFEGDRIFWGDTVNYIISDNSNDFVLDDSNVFYHMIIRDDKGDAVSEYITRSFYNVHNEIPQSEELSEGRYSIEIDSYLNYYRGLGLTSNNCIYSELTFDDVMSFISSYKMPKIGTYKKDFIVSSKGDKGQIPNEKYIADIKKIYTEIPERLNCSYNLYMTRLDASELALTFYDRTVVHFERPQWDLYDDTDNEYAEGAAIHLMPRFGDSFKENAFITREEFATTLKRYLAYRWIAYDDYFKLIDVSNVKINDIGMVGNDYKNDVKFMVKHGIMDLKPNGQFDPKGKITREEAFAYLSRLYDLNNDKFLYLKYE